MVTNNAWNSEDPAQVAKGGTGAASFTEGSVFFMGGSVFSEDNSNLFWNNTDKCLGVGTNTPLETLEVTGNMKLNHTAAFSNEHAFEALCDAAGFGDIKCVDIVYITGAVSGGDQEECILVNIDQSASTGGEVFGIEILSTGAGSADVFGTKHGVTVNPILQNSGTFGDADSILNKAVDVTAALANGGAGNISVFVADNDTMTIGDAAQFAEMEFLLDTVASGGGIAPTFEFSTGVGTWTTFSPADGTNGLRNNGIVAWDVADIPTWVIGTGSEFLIRITRTRNTLTTTPILDEVQIGGDVVFSWDKSGDLIVNLVATAGVTVDPGAAGDSFVQFDINTTGEFRIGVDDTDDSFRISQGSALGTNDTFIVTAAGEVTKPLTPAFLAQSDAGTTQLNVTGAGTQYTVLYPTEIFDVNSDYSSPNFTAPVTGKYCLWGGVIITALDDLASNGILNVATSNRPHTLFSGNVGAMRAVGNDLTLKGSVIADMDAADTASININVQNMGGDTVDVAVASTASNQFGGFLVG